MRIKPDHFIRFLILAVISITMFSSCVPYKNLLYLRSEAEEDDTVKQKEIYPLNLSEYKVQPGDNLYIRLLSVNEDLTEYINTSGINTGYDASIYLESYSVNDSGFITMPVIGEIYVNNMSLAQITDLIQKELDKYLKEVAVIVKLVNFNISVMGEVLAPGQYKIYQDQVNVFEVISMAGDMTPYAKRDNVVLIRQTQDGSVIFRLNLQDISILESEQYYMQPNDIVYVEPVRGRNFLFTAFPYTLFFGSVTTVLLIMTYFKN